MRIVLTNHARIRASERWISFEEIIEAIQNPDEIQQQDDEIFCFKKYEIKKEHMIFGSEFDILYAPPSTYISWINDLVKNNVFNV